MKKTRINKQVICTLEEKKLAKKLHKSSLPLIHCKCGVSILVLPNAKMMSNAIERHIKTHHAKPAKNASVEEIRQHLIAQVLSVASIPVQE
ncbi:MAG: hypothetical protein NWE92_10490 [Candidatus Bathyarchaeota archaeon]|nr:hypothetical protein [Candidatus Bathyarchaeota archaeon]